jgi:hypothetical protein
MTAKPVWIGHQIWVSAKTNTASPSPRLDLLSLSLFWAFLDICV